MAGPPGQAAAPAPGASGPDMGAITSQLAAGKNSTGVATTLYEMVFGRLSLGEHGHSLKKAGVVAQGGTMDVSHLGLKCFALNSSILGRPLKPFSVHKWNGVPGGSGGGSGGGGVGMA